MFIDTIIQNKSNDGEEVGIKNPDREFPDGERGGEAYSEYISQLQTENAETSAELSRITHRLT